MDNMSEALQEKKWAQNEQVFRQHNEKVINELVSTKEIAKEHGQLEYAKGIDDLALLFYCECSNENCRLRIPLTPKEYTDKHQNSSQFILIPGHHIPKIERIVHDYGHYVVVEKFITPPKKAKKLNIT
jgi:hypothetical protein